MKEQAHFRTALSSFGKASWDKWIATLELCVIYEHGTRKRANQGKDNNTRIGGGKKDGSGVGKSEGKIGEKGRKEKRVGGR